MNDIDVIYTIKIRIYVKMKNIQTWEKYHISTSSLTSSREVLAVVDDVSCGEVGPTVKLLKLNKKYSSCR